VPAPSSEGTNDSVCNLSAQWETDDGKKMALADLNGQVRVISMFYSTCQGVCVITKNNMQQIDASLSPATRERVKFVLVTLDPARDTAAALRSYRRVENMPASRWTLLRGDDAATGRLASFLGVAYGRDSSGRFIHSSEIVILDSDGRVLHRHNGVAANLSGIASEVDAAVSHQAPPALSRVPALKPARVLTNS
jgi:protein SCO1/2